MPTNNQDIRHGKGFGFWVVKAGKEAQVYLMRCFKCGRENWAPNVATGCCSWCGYDANQDSSVPR